MYLCITLCMLQLFRNDEHIKLNFCDVLIEIWTNNFDAETKLYHVVTT